MLSGRAVFLYFDWLCQDVQQCHGSLPNAAASVPTLSVFGTTPVVKAAGCGLLCHLATVGRVVTFQFGKYYYKCFQQLFGLKLELLFVQRPQYVY